MTEKQIKKLEEKKEKIDNKICNLRASRQESKDKDDIEAIIEINAKIYCFTKFVSLYFNTFC